METYTFIIEGSPSSASTLNVMLALGKYSTSYTTGLTTGYAVFDNLSLTKLDDGEEYKAAVESERNATDLSALTTRTATLKTSNGRFDFGTTSLSSSGTPNGWALVTGNSGKNDSAPSSLGYNAVIDVSKFADNYEKYSTTYYTKANSTAEKRSYVPASSLEAITDAIQNLPTSAVGTNVFMLSQQLMTAQGIKSSRSITMKRTRPTLFPSTFIPMVFTVRAHLWCFRAATARTSPSKVSLPTPPKKLISAVRLSTPTVMRTARSIPVKPQTDGRLTPSISKATNSKISATT